MSIPFKPRLAQYQVDRLSSPAVLTTYVESTADSYGDESYVETTYNINVIISTVTNTRMPFVRRGTLGHYYMMQVEFFTMDSIPTGAIPTDNTATDKPPTLVHANLEYEITEIEDSGVGVIRLIGYRKRV